MPPSEILVFGEDLNDTTAIAHLTRAILPEGLKTTVRPIRRPIILAKTAADRKRGKMSDEVARFAKGYEKGGVKVTVVAHRDCDAIEPAHLENSKQLEADLKAAGVRSVVAATPAWEIEAWWMLFPKAVQATRSGWRPVDYGSSHVGSIENAKERLTRDLRPSGKISCRDFHESDGIKIAETVAKDKVHIARMKARSDSFVAFREKLLAEIKD